MSRWDQRSTLSSLNGLLRDIAKDVAITSSSNKEIGIEENIIVKKELAQVNELSTLPTFNDLSQDEVSQELNFDLETILGK